MGSGQDIAIDPKLPFCQFTCHAGMYAEKLGYSEDDECC